MPAEPPSLFVKNAWYVAAWDFELDAQALLTRVIASKPIVLYRTAARGVVALEDRCIHRAAPLSLGRREGDDLRCMYHGLKFNPTGQCIDIPGQERIPPTMRVRSHPAIEKNRWIWIWLGDPVQADPALIPDCFALQHPAWAWKPGYLHYKASHQLVVDNLLDFSHLNYVHPTTLGGTEAPTSSKVTRIARGLRIERWQLDDVPAPFQASLKKFSGNVDRWYFYDFVLPAVLTMHSGVQATGTGAPEGRFRDALEFRSCQAITPETATTSHYFFALPHNFDTDDERVTDSIHQSVLTAFAEDRQIIEAQQANLLMEPDGPLVGIAADAALSQFRRLVQEHVARESAA